MPIYNGIEFIEESVDSIKSQTFKDWELIISVNGHAKNSEVYNIASKYQSHNIKVYDFFDLKGKSVTLNESLQLCSYDKICLLDVDDIWMPTKLEQQAKFVNVYDVVGTNCQYFGDRNDRPFLQFGELNKSIIQQYNPIINSSACFSKCDARWNGEYDSVEDYEMWLRLANENKTFYNINDILVKHRIHATSCFNASGKQGEILKKLKLKYA